MTTASIMANHKSSPRDRHLSDSPDPINSSISRESGMACNLRSSGSLFPFSSGASITSSLRISKRDSPGRPTEPAVARRSSSSYKHVHSPTFPTSSPTRRVSGEKRPRPSSLYEQTEDENVRPFALKRERRQSQGFQDLNEKGPVTRSPFELGQRTSSDARPSSSPIPAPLTRTPLTSFATSTTSVQPPASFSVYSPPAISPGPTPGRSSLVSKRLHGPCSSFGGNRERRKTVGFDERCDVVAFERDEEIDEEIFEMDEDEYANDEQPGIWRVTRVRK